MFSINKIKFSLLKYLYQNKKIIVTEQDFISIWKSDIFTLEIKNRKAIPKIIWAFWDSKEMPEVVKICINNWKELHPDFEINILNNETIHTFLPNFPKLKDFNPVFKSDLLRLSLLKEYGGIYLDASVFLNQRLDQYISFYIENNLDLLVFSSEGHPNDKKYPITESWFIISEKTNLFIEKWLFYLTEVFLSNDFESYFKDNKTRKIAYNSVNETKRDYFYIYMASQLAMREITNTKIFSDLLVKKYGADAEKDALQELKFGVKLFPSTYFSLDLPKNYIAHHFSGSWHGAWSEEKNTYKNLVNTYGLMKLFSEIPDGKANVKNVVYNHQKIEIEEVLNQIPLSYLVKYIKNQIFKKLKIK